MKSINRTTQWAKANSTRQTSSRREEIREVVRGDIQEKDQ